MTTRTGGVKMASLLATIALGACSSGTPYNLSMNVPIKPEAVYRPMTEGSCALMVTTYASQTIIAPGFALTNAHADGSASVPYIESPFMDLALLKIEDGHAIETAIVQNGEKTIQYGTGCMGDTRIALGHVVSDDYAVCWGSMPTENTYCSSQGYGAARGFLIESDGGEGFSGGPVLNSNGKLIGITEGIVDYQGKVAMFSYRIEDALATFAPVMDHPEQADWQRPWLIDPKLLAAMLML